MKNNPQSRIGIIGAGLAGLTVAYRLYQKGYDIDVFEARQRVGGRVHSVFLRNQEDTYSIGELGGQNITDGGDASHMLSLIKELKLEIEEDKQEIIYRFNDGKKFHETKDILDENKKNKKIFEERYKIFLKKCSSMKELIDQIFEGYPTQHQLYTNFLKAYEGSPPENLSIYHNAETLYYMMQGGVSESHKTSVIHRASLKNGNASLPIKLAGLLKGRVHCQKILSHVFLNENKKLKLHFKDGFEDIYDQLILAIPISLYSEIKFDEKLISSEKINNFKNVQCGTNTKILLSTSLSDTSYNSFASQDFVSFYNFDKKLVNLYFTGEMGRNLSKDFLLSGKRYEKICEELEKGWGKGFDSRFPELACDQQFSIYKTPVMWFWVSDPYSKGSYSNYGVFLGSILDEKENYKGVEFKKIYAPLHDCLFFVGEHTTILSEIGTMEAAIESGERLAKLF